MAVRAIGGYDFPSRSRQELYGEDQLVHVWWRNNLWFCAAGCFRVPRAMTFADFLAEIVTPWASGDPSFDVAAITDWILDDEPLDPTPDRTLAELGVGHKSLLEFRAPSTSSAEALTG